MIVTGAAEPQSLSRENPFLSFRLSQCKHCDCFISDNIDIIVTFLFNRSALAKRLECPAQHRRSVVGFPLGSYIKLKNRLVAIDILSGARHWENSTKTG